MSARQTTREEDAAYCLLGVLDVNMPLLYGEGGAKAFRRLQFELMSQSADETILAWGLRPDRLKIGRISWGSRTEASGSCIASHPKDFVHSRHITNIVLAGGRFVTRPPYVVTNQGLYFTSEAFRLIPTDERSRIWKGMNEETFASPPDQEAEMYVLPLNCQYRGDDRQCMIAVQVYEGIASRVTCDITAQGSFDDSVRIWQLGKSETKEFLLDIGRVRFVWG